MVIYPNHLNNILNNENFNDTRFQFVNTLGQTVLLVEKSEQKIQLNLSAYQTGLYFIKTFDSIVYLVKKYH